MPWNLPRQPTPQLGQTPQGAPANAPAPQPGQPAAPNHPTQKFARVRARVRNAAHNATAGAWDKADELTDRALEGTGDTVRSAAGKVGSKWNTHPRIRKITYGVAAAAALAATIYGVTREGEYDDVNITPSTLGDGAENTPAPDPAVEAQKKKRDIDMTFHERTGQFKARVNNAPADEVWTPHVITIPLGSGMYEVQLMLTSPQHPGFEWRHTAQNRATGFSLSFQLP